ncbi:hypothetical protein EIN_077720 [Entamoeba invadens IP1]|uniref:Uncharacterized protein n=1 Tax=Entamoeba invadens IP1 TaxID=370355 RepID=A0A0A1TYJ7_ENTIV|nr:hypothetical protein EIN_077720 [Entamoeba invadens IP1]ELP83587.1 hypothetical protein EIN_077720 [Entamoeba invadens IP1]|eukprot:XP_004182933.1 hypothetical protein EIN_077720 [Entamoeba invadens IP1]
MNIFIFVIFLTNFVSSVNLNLPSLKSNWMTDFLVVNMDSSEITYNVVTECYKHIPNNKRLISALNLNSVCYLSHSSFFIHKNGQNITRCGEWLSVTGPSQTNVHCMVAGSADMYYYGVKIEKNGNNLVGLKRRLFLLGTSQMKYIKDSVYQATVSISDCLLQIPPSLVVLNVTQNEVVVQVINVNRPVALIQINYNNCYKNEDDTFTLSRLLNTSNIKIISIDNEKIGMSTLLEKVGYIANATTSFQRYSMDQCKYIAAISVYYEGQVVKNPLMIWYTYKVNKTFKPELLNMTKSMIITKDGDGDIMLTFIYGAAFLMSQDFSQFKCQLEVNFVLEIIDVKLMLITNMEKAGSQDGAILVRENLTYKYIQDKNTVSLFIAMDKTCKEFTNGLLIRYKSKTGDILILKNSSFDNVQEIQKMHQCDEKSFDCDNTECTVDNNSLDVGTRKWKSGCEPICGRCNEGYMCTTMGRCVLTKNNNMRSNALRIENVLFYFYMASELFFSINNQLQ